MTRRRLTWLEPVWPMLPPLAARVMSSASNRLPLVLAVVMVPPVSAGPLVV
jgi:hypothetical protein